MRKLLALVGVFGLLASACAGTLGIGDETVQGSGTITTVAVAVAGFGRVLLAGQGEVAIALGTAPGLTIETDDNLHEYIEVEVDDNTLVISTRDGFTLDPSDEITYRVVAVSFDTLELSGSGRITAPALTAATMDVTLSGSGDIRFGAIDVGDFSVDIPGSGVVSASGTGLNGDLTVSGSGSIAAADLALERATVLISGSGTADVWVRDELDVTVSGSGTVSYFGSPRLEESVTGSGSVIASGDK
jgi:Putative auto-transporter adhesin, head GIN domain